MSNDAKPCCETARNLEAARKRISEVPPGPTLIDGLSDAEFNDPAAAEFDIRVGKLKDKA